MSDIEGSIAELLANINRRCPKFVPTIFSTKYYPKTVEDLLSASIQEKDSTKDWIASLSYSHPQVSISTKVSVQDRTIEIASIKFVNELDFLLSHPEKVLLMLMQGTKEEITIAVSRFMELNGYDADDMTSGRSIFNEVYNSIYALRVLISNMPFRVTLAGHPTVALPIKDEKVDLASTFKNLINNGCEDEEVKAVSKKSKKNDKKQSGKQSDKQQQRSVEEDGDEKETTEAAVGMSTGEKKKKRKRAK